jgi:hypothetical protein
MPVVKITRKGKDPQQFLREVNGKIHMDFQALLVKLGDECAAMMGNIIRSSVKREGSIGTLENSIKSKFENITAGVHVGIGKIDELPIYWSVINSGGYVPPQNIGYFGDGNPPRFMRSGEQWTHIGQKGTEFGYENFFRMNPIKPIEPVNYVDIAADELERAVDAAIKELENEVDQAAR